MLKMVIYSIICRKKVHLQMHIKNKLTDEREGHFVLCYFIFLFWFVCLLFLFGFALLLSCCFVSFVLFFYFLFSVFVMCRCRFIVCKLAQDKSADGSFRLFRFLRWNVFLLIVVTFDMFCHSHVCRSSFFLCNGFVFVTALGCLCIFWCFIQ